MKRLFSYLRDIDAAWLATWSLIFICFLTLEAFFPNFWGVATLKVVGIALCVIYACQKFREDILLIVALSFTFLADIILAVSERFCRWLKEYYPGYRDKFDHVSNGIDMPLMPENFISSERDVHMIFSIGGGMPRKMIRYICDAVAMLRDEYDPEMYVCVIGDKGADTEKLRSYDFVKDLGIVPFSE
ncbi:hypothetical protein J6Z37_00195, partial [Candidatus Saccharibacteria bacterium]|nr:hypothetical protein [Candidatus Saccharibacteria bacterium]